MDLKEIQTILPHRPPFLFVDEVSQLTDKKIVAHRTIKEDEYFFAGHFPGNPIMPGVLIVEALAQAGGIMAMRTRKGSTPLFMAIDKARFRRIVRPGDTLTLEVEVLHERESIVKLSGVARVGGDVACQAIIMAGIKT